jgi:hypothetical protein
MLNEETESYRPSNPSQQNNSAIQGTKGIHKPLQTPVRWIFNDWVPFKFKGTNEPSYPYRISARLTTLVCSFLFLFVYFGATSWGD